jgi:hypothetical protein
MKSRPNLESFEIVRIRDGDNVNDTGKIRAFHAVITHPMRRDRFKTRLRCTAFVIYFLQHFRSLL